MRSRSKSFDKISAQKRFRIDVTHRAIGQNSDRAQFINSNAKVESIDRRNETAVWMKIENIRPELTFTWMSLNQHRNESNRYDLVLELFSEQLD